MLKRGGPAAVGAGTSAATKGAGLPPGICRILPVTTMPPPAPATDGPALAIDAAKGTRPGRPAWLGAAAVAVYAALAWLLMLAFPEGLPVPNLDQSWSAVVSKAAAEHWRFGHEIMLNYGPLAHLGTGFYHPDLFTTNFLFQILSKALLVAMVCRVGGALPTTGRWLFLLVNLVVGILDWEAIHLWAVVYAGWLLSEDRTRTGRPLGYAGLALAAAASLMKLYFFVFTVAVLGCVFARELWRGRGSPSAWRDACAPLAAFGVFFVGAWVFAGQRADDLLAYLHGSFQLMNGYSRAIGFDPPLSVLLLGLVILACLGALSGFLLVGGERVRRLAMLPLAALFAGTLLMAWKEGYTRADSFHVSGFLFDAAIAATALPLFFDRRRLSPTLHYTGVGVVWGLAIIAMTLARGTEGRMLLTALRERPAHNLSVLFRPDDERLRLDKAVVELRKRFRLPRVRAAVGNARIDIFGTAQALALLNDLNYAPTPILQNYMAYTPYLAGLVARCYEPDRAPEFVLFEGGSIDWRLPWLDGVEQLREVLWNYAPVLLENHLLLLRRKPPAAQTNARPALRISGEITVDERLDVPAEDADWCELEVHETLWGKLVNALYHQTPPIMEVTTSDGRRTRWQMPTVMARGGFLLRNGPKSLEDVGYLLNGKPVPNPVVAIRLLDTPKTHWAIGPRVAYRFYHLDPIVPVQRGDAPPEASEPR